MDVLLDRLQLWVAISDGEEKGEKLRFKTGKGAKPKILLKSPKLGSLCGLKMLSSDDGLADPTVSYL